MSSSIKWLTAAKPRRPVDQGARGATRRISCRTARAGAEILARSGRSARPAVNDSGGDAMRHDSVLPVLATMVAGEWVDYNGHMNDAAYAIVFSRSVDALMDRVGLDSAARKRTGQSLFTLQMMLHYFKEAREGDALAVSCHILEHDDKRLRVWLDMSAPSGERLAASEQLLISVAIDDAGTRAVPWAFETKA